MAYDKMDEILKKLAPDHRARFMKKYISTDIVCYLSIEDFLKLGLIDCNAIIPLGLSVQLSVYALHKGQLELTNSQ